MVRRRAVDKVRNEMEEDVHNKLEEDGGRKIIFKLAPFRDEDSKDMKGGGEGGGD